MLYKIIVKPEAENDLDKAIEWYENQRQGLGIDFLLHYEDVVTLIRKNPFLYIKVALIFRKALLRRFPYAIYYAVHEEEKIVDIYAVIHTSRNPNIVQKQLKL